MSSIGEMDAEIEAAEHLLAHLREERAQETQRLAHIGEAIERAIGARLDDDDLDTLCRLLRQRREATGKAARRPAPGSGVHGFFPGN